MGRSWFPDPVETCWPALNWPGWLRRLVTGVFFVAINWLMLAPAGVFRTLHLFLAHQDKMAHGAIFLALAGLVRWSAPAAYVRGRRRAALLAALVLYAAGIEVFQPLLASSGRLFEWLDLASNYAGVGVGWLIFGLMIAGEAERRAADAVVR